MTERRLTGEAFSRLLRRLNPDPEAAGLAYELLRRRLLTWFERRNCHWPDSLADETLDRLAKRLLEGVEIASVSAYAIGIAKLVYQESLRRPAHQSLSLEDVTPALERKAVEGAGANSWEERELDAARARALRDCLQALPRREREILQAYYHDHWKTQVEQRKRTAEKLGLAESSLRARIHRLRRTLKRCLKKRTEGAD